MDAFQRVWKEALEIMSQNILDGLRDTTKFLSQGSI
jgi:hypothetical protein